MNPSSMLLSVEFNEIAQLLIFFVPVLLFAIYKIISRVLKHRYAKMVLEKGFVPKPRTGPKKPRWIRSLYIGVFLLLVSSPFLINYITTAIDQRDAMEMPLYLFSVIPFAVGIAYILRGLPKRKDHIRTLALKNAVPFEQVYAPLPWIIALAIGIPLLGYAVVIYLLCFFADFASLPWTPPYSYERLPLIVAIPGGMFTLYGLLTVCFGRKKSSPMPLSEKQAQPTCLEAN